MTIEQIITALEMAAGRGGASMAQVRYLSTLMHQAGDTPEGWGLSIGNTSAVLTKRAASSMIDNYLKAESRAADNAAAVEAEKAAAATAPATLSIKEEQAALHEALRAFNPERYAEIQEKYAADYSKRKKKMAVLRKQYEDHLAASAASIEKRFPPMF